MTLKDLIYLVAKENDIETEGKKLKQVIEETKEYIFDFDFPFWNEDLRSEFERKILMHFITYTLAESDSDMWLFRLDEVINLIMPYYNQMLKSETWFDEYITNPAANTDYKEFYTKEVENSQRASSEDIAMSNDKVKSSDETNSKTEGENTNDSTSYNISNDYPKSSIEEDLTDYASEGTKGVAETKATNKSEINTKSSSESESESNGKSTSEGESESNGTETYEFRRVGNIGVQTPGEVFESTRKAFINTMELIYRDPEIRNLFIRVWE